MLPNIAAIVPMRHCSERVVGKNYRSFAGEPLYRRIVQTLLTCHEVRTVMIDTYSEFIMEDAAKTFPSVLLYQRPDHLRDGMTPMNEVLLNSVEQVDADFYLQTHSTNPLLSTDSFSRAIRAFSKQLSEHDSLFSVTRMQTRLWDSSGQPINHDPSLLLRTQDLEPVFEENSCMYIFSKASLKKYGNRLGESPMMFEIDKLEAQDIDDEQDFKLAEMLYRQTQTLGSK